MNRFTITSHDKKSELIEAAKHYIELEAITSAQDMYDNIFNVYHNYNKYLQHGGFEGGGKLELIIFSRNLEEFITKHYFDNLSDYIQINQAQKQHYIQYIYDNYYNEIEVSEADLDNYNKLFTLKSKGLPQQNYYIFMLTSILELHILHQNVLADADK